MKKINIAQLLREAADDETPKATSNSVTPDDDVRKTSKDEPNKLYGTVKNLLEDDIINHSAVIRRLWGNDDATNRSLFRKKLEQEKAQDSESTYEFTVKELQEILTILHSVGKKMSSAIVNKSKADRKKTTTPEDYLQKSE